MIKPQTVSEQGQPFLVVARRHTLSRVQSLNG